MQTRNRLQPYGGYAHRQLFELVQNSADALLDSPKGRSILIRLTDGFLYCADDGEPIDEDGIVGLMFSRMSSKRNTAAIGRFGLGFKSVLGVTDSPEFYSRSGTFRFDKACAAQRIAEVARAERYPVLRLPEAIDPHKERDQDEDLGELMSWATNIVRLPLVAGAYGDLAQQIREFPPEFLLFVDHVRYLTLEDGEFAREFILQDRQGELHLNTGEGITRWQRFRTTHCLSPEARDDWPLHGDNDHAPIWWAAPLGRLDRPGQFWAFFPTSTASLVAGILNAPWKTNEDRQNLLAGPYNDELIEAAARMIAGKLPGLTTKDDPARHLDALPRRQQPGDSKQSVLLRSRLFSHLRTQEIVPDQHGELRACDELSYPPKELTPDGKIDTAPFEQWEAYPGRPSNWLHHAALTRNRLAAIDRLFDSTGPGGSNLAIRLSPSGAPRATVANWLEALAIPRESDNEILASMAAVRVAALIPPEVRARSDVGEIVLTAADTLQEPDPEFIFLPGETPDDNSTANLESWVHPKLASDHTTLRALKELGLKPPSPESRFRLIAERVLEHDSYGEPSDGLHREFWIAARKLSAQSVLGVIRGLDDVWPARLRVRTEAGTWQPLHSVLLPGEIVPGDGSRDDESTVDTRYHEPDDQLLRALGATEVPQGGRDLSSEESYISFRRSCRFRYAKQDNLPHNPDKSYLKFGSSMGVGPLSVLATLSGEGNALYTDALLNLDASFEPWTMHHTGTNRRAYPNMPCESLTIHMLREHGRVRTPGGIVPMKNALGPRPTSPEALAALLVHSNADKIKAALDLTEPNPEFFGGKRIPFH